VGSTNLRPKSDTRSATEDQTDRPPKYKVLLHNDDYTTQDFVVMVLRSVFHKAPSDAVRIMLNVHHNGLGVCGVYSAEIAETKVDRVHSLASQYGHPLKCSMEPE